MKPGTPESLLTHAWKSLPRNERKAVFEELTNDPSFRRISAVDCSLESNQPDAVPLIETRFFVFLIYSFIYDLIFHFYFIFF